MHARVLISECGNKMFLCIKDVLEAGAAPGLPVPAGSPGPAVPSPGHGARACQRGRGGCTVSPWGWQCCQSTGLAPGPLCCPRVRGWDSHGGIAGAAAPAVSPGWFPSNVCLSPVPDPAGLVLLSARMWPRGWKPPPERAGHDVRGRWKCLKIPLLDGDVLGLEPGGSLSWCLCERGWSRAWPGFPSPGSVTGPSAAISRAPRCLF